MNYIKDIVNIIGVEFNKKFVIKQYNFPIGKFKINGKGIQYLDANYNTGNQLFLYGLINGVFSVNSLSGKNKANKLADILGIKIGEKFYVKETGTTNLEKYVFKDNVGIVNVDTGYCADIIQEKIIYGKATIVK